MSLKLYASETHASSTSRSTEPEVSVDELDQKLSEMLEDAQSTTEIATEHVNTLLESIDTLHGVKLSLEAHVSSKGEYMALLSNSEKFLKQLAYKTGYKGGFVATEDFNSAYGFKAAHAFCMESTDSMLYRLWDKVRKFFRDMFKRILLLLKRLAGAELELEEYEEYIDSLIRKIKHDKLTCKNTEEFESKLPELLADIGMDKVDVAYIQREGVRRIENFIRLYESLTQSSGMIEAFGLSVAGLAVAARSIKGASPVAVGNELAKTVAALQASQATIFKNDLTGSRDLPEMVYETVERVFGNDRDAKLTVRAMIDSTRAELRLPMNLNAYAITRQDSAKLAVVSVTERNDMVVNRLRPLQDVRDLIKFHELYLEMTKKIQPRKLADKVDMLGDRVDEQLDLIRNMQIELEELRKHLESTQPGVGPMTFADLEQSSGGLTQYAAALANQLIASYANFAKQAVINDRHTVRPGMVMGGVPWVLEPHAQDLSALNYIYGKASIELMNLFTRYHEVNAHDQDSYVGEAVVGQDSTLQFPEALLDFIVSEEAQQKALEIVTQIICPNGALDPRLKDFYTYIDPLSKIAQTSKSKLNARELCVRTSVRGFMFNADLDKIFDLKAPYALTPERKAPISQEQVELLLRSISDVREGSMTLMSALQTFLKTVSIEIAGTDRRLRFELIKYIYNSAKRFK